MHGPTVSALSSLALPYVPTNSFFLHTKTPTHRNSSPFPNQAYLFTLHPLCPTTPTEPPPHPTRIAHSSDWRTRWRSSRLGFSSFLFFFFFSFFPFHIGFLGLVASFFFIFPFHFQFLFFAWDRSPTPTASHFSERVIGVTFGESCSNGDEWLDSLTGFEWDFQRRRYDCEFPGATFIKLRIITPGATLGFLSKKIKKTLIWQYTHMGLCWVCVLIITVYENCRKSVSVIVWEIKDGSCYF